MDHQQEESMKIALQKATRNDKETIQNLGRFYIYEMSRYCGFLPRWETPKNGLFECIDLSTYVEDPLCHAFLIKVDEELAGFVLINKIGSSQDVDWNVGEFFVISKFQGKGVGRHVAEQVFNQFPGTWETTQIPENKAAIDFWKDVVNNYTNGNFESDLKIIPKPKPHPMVVLKFTSGPIIPPSQQTDYHLEYQIEINHDDENILFEGINDDAVQKKNMDRIKSFGIFAKNSQGVVLGGATGITMYGNMYVDMLWVEEELRHHGLGKKLMIEAEKIGRQRNCTFATVNTMDWEALTFYQKLGYEIEFTREGYDKDSKMYMLRKSL
jgi:Predicted acetyltransferase